VRSCEADDGDRTRDPQLGNSNLGLRIAAKRPSQARFVPIRSGQISLFGDNIWDKAVAR
jgi:hypothetical protein